MPSGLPPRAAGHDDVRRSRLEQLAEDRRYLGLAQPCADAGLHHAAEPRGVEAFENLRDQLRRARPEPSPCPFGRIGQPVYDRARDVEPPHPARDDRRQQEIVAQEYRQRIADPVLVPRDDRGVRDRQPERMAEQRGDRKPVRQSADHRRLGKGPDEADRGVPVDQRAADQEHDRHQHQQPGRDDPHANESRVGRFLGQAHAGIRCHARNNPRAQG